MPGSTPRAATWTGYEINYQQPLTFLPGFLTHTGVLLNYTHVKSSINYPNGAGAVVATANLTGLSPRPRTTPPSTTRTAKWSAWVSASYRDSYLSRVPVLEAGTDADGTTETLNVDASLQYTINDNFKLALEGVNLTDEQQDQFNDSVADRSSFYHHTGREFILGVRYTY